MTQQELKIPKKWKEIEAPFEPFTNVGDKLEGMLLNKDQSTKYGFGLYTMKTFDNKQVKFHGSKQLDDLLIGIKIPAYVKIEFVDTLETSMGTMKVFKVFEGQN